MRTIRTNQLDEVPTRDELVEMLARASFGAPSMVWWSTEEGPVGYECNVETDDTSAFDHINGCDTYGKVSWDPNTGRPVRPHDFTGAAELLWAYGDRYWWEPYREGHKVYNAPEDRQMVEDLVIHGLIGLKVERLAQCECCGQRSTTGFDSIWGIEATVSDADKADFIRDLLHEIDGESGATHFKEGTT